MPGGRLLRGAAAASMISSARTNRAVRKNIEGQNEAQQQANQAAQAAPQDDLTAQLEQLNNLKNQGILTQEEFDAKKKQLLGI
jgi:membrane protease subunit (stomatin/prohibitin family)